MNEPRTPAHSDAGSARLGLASASETLRSAVTSARHVFYHEEEKRK